MRKKDLSKDYEVAELTWENGQLSMHGLGGLFLSAPTKPTWGRAAGETLESIVHQATIGHMPNQDLAQYHDQGPATICSLAAATTSSAGKWADSLAHKRMASLGPNGKRVRPGSDRCRRHFGAGIQGDPSACASASAGASASFCKENDTTLMTWASFESPLSLKTRPKTMDEDSGCQGESQENREEEEEVEEDEEEREAKEGISCRSHSISRRSRAAAVHNLSERRRRDRINQKMKALQKLVPNASKTDKASMLDEVIEYLKQLQAQVHFMSTLRNNMPQMMMPPPIGIQQQMQMSLLARMGMGVGFGMGMGMGGIMDINTMAATAAAARAVPHQSLSPLMHPTTSVPPHPPFVLPTVIPMQNQAHASAANHAAAAPNGSAPFTDPYSTFVAQSMNMDLYNKMAALYRQQVNQGRQQTIGSLPAMHPQRE